ncbi:unnamed protein product [Ectocarpus sp. 12 AP-2014]
MFIENYECYLWYRGRGTADKEKSTGSTKVYADVERNCWVRDVVRRKREESIQHTRSYDDMYYLVRTILGKVSVVPDGRRESHLLARFNSQVLGISRRQTCNQWFETSDQVLRCAERSVGLLFNHVERARYRGSNFPILAPASREKEGRDGKIKRRSIDDEQIIECFSSARSVYPKSTLLTLSVRQHSRWGYVKGITARVA